MKGWFKPKSSKSSSDQNADNMTQQSLATAEGHLKQLRQSNQPNFPLLNEATRLGKDRLKTGAFVIGSTWGEHLHRVCLLVRSTTD